MNELRKRGAAVVGVVVDPVETNAELARDAELGYPILSDPELRIIDAYGLRHHGAGPDGRDIARTASVLVDPQGVVRWRFVTTNLRVRPLPEDLLAAIDRLR
jgi:peroxiredoxin